MKKIDFIIFYIHISENNLIILSEREVTRWGFLECQPDEHIACLDFKQIKKWAEAGKAIIRHLAFQFLPAKRNFDSMHLCYLGISDIPANLEQECPRISSIGRPVMIHSHLAFPSFSPFSCHFSPFRGLQVLKTAKA
jgi:hypothetical protein